MFQVTVRNASEITQSKRSRGPVNKNQTSSQSSRKKRGSNQIKNQNFFHCSENPPMSKVKWWKLIIFEFLIFFVLLTDAEKHRSFEIKHNNPDAEKLMAEFMSKFKEYGERLKTDFFKFSQMFIKRIKTDVDMNKSIDDVSDVVQKYYSCFNDHLNSDEVYRDLNSEAKEHLLNFFEKYAMTLLYRWVITQNCHRNVKFNKALLWTWNKKKNKIYWIDLLLSEVTWNTFIFELCFSIQRHRIILWNYLFLLVECLRVDYFYLCNFHPYL